VGAWRHLAVRVDPVGCAEFRISALANMTSILSQYLMRAIFASTALVLIVLLALAGLFEFIAELDDTQGDYQTPQAIMYAVLRLPQLASEMLPMAALIGSLLGLGGLAAGSEIIVMRSAGLSVWRLAGMVSMAGLVLLILAGLIAEFIGPPLDYFARMTKIEARLEKGDARLGNATWVKDGPVYLHLERVNADFDFGSIYLFRFDEDNRLDSIAMAENSGIDKDDKWILENFHQTQFQGDGVQVAEAPVAIRSFDVNAEMLGISLVKPHSLSGRGLLSYISYLNRNSLDAGLYETELWYRISRTVTVMIMPVLALAFVFGSLRTGGAGGRLMIGVVIGLAYYLASEMLANSGTVFDLNPAIVAWFPSGLIALITIYAIKRIR
jgi:lipopolysaccharide export system permease protein